MGDVTTYTGDGEIVFSGPDGIKIIKRWLQVAFITEDRNITDYLGRPIKLSVTNANELGGIPSSSYLKKTDIPVFPEVNKTTYNTLAASNTIEELCEFHGGYIGQAFNISFPATGDELLPNPYLNDVNSILTGNGATISVSNNILTVTAGTQDLGYGYQLVSLEAGKTYLLAATCAGTSPGTEVIGPDSLVNLPVGNYPKRIITPTMSGLHMIKMVVNTTTDNASATFASISVKEINLTALPIGNYWTKWDIGLNQYLTFISTGIKSYDINHDVSTAYNKNIPGRNLAFLRQSFTLLKYISDTPNQVGFIRLSDGRYKEIFIDANGNSVGDFDATDDMIPYKVTGNIARTLIHGGAMQMKRTSASGALPEVYTDITTIPGELCYFEFEVASIVDNWSVQCGSLKLQINNIGDGLTDNTKFKFVYRATGTTTRFKFVAESTTTTATLLIKSLHGYYIDSTIWEDITPVNNGDKTPALDFYASEVQIIGGSGGTYRSESRYNSLLGIYNQISGTVVPNATTVNRPDSLRAFTETGIWVGSNRYGCNYSGSLHSIIQTVFNKVIMVKDNRGVLSLIAYDKTNNVSLMLTNASPDNLIPEKIPHMLRGLPVTITQFPVNYKGVVQRIVRPNGYSDRILQYSPFSTAQPIYGATAPIALGDFNAIDFSIYTQQDIGKIHCYKCEGESSNRLDMLYSGNNNTVTIPWDKTIDKMDIVPLEYPYSKLSTYAGFGGISYFIYNDASNSYTATNGVFIKQPGELLIFKPSTLGGSVNSNDGKMFYIGIRSKTTAYGVKLKRYNTAFTGKASVATTMKSENGYDVQKEDITPTQLALSL